MLDNEDADDLLDEDYPAGLDTEEDDDEEGDREESEEEETITVDPADEKDRVSGQEEDVERRGGDLEDRRGSTESPEEDIPPDSPERQLNTSTIEQDVTITETPTELSSVKGAEGKESNVPVNPEEDLNKEDAESYLEHKDNNNSDATNAMKSAAIDSIPLSENNEEVHSDVQKTFEESHSNGKDNLEGAVKVDSSERDSGKDDQLSKLVAPQGEVFVSSTKEGESSATDGNAVSEKKKLVSPQGEVLDSTAKESESSATDGNAVSEKKKLVSPQGEVLDSTAKESESSATDGNAVSEKKKLLSPQGEVLDSSTTKESKSSATTDGNALSGKKSVEEVKESLVSLIDAPRESSREKSSLKKVRSAEDMKSSMNGCSISEGSEKKPVRRNSSQSRLVFCDSPTTINEFEANSSTITLVASSESTSSPIKKSASSGSFQIYQSALESELRKINIPVSTFKHSDSQPQTPTRNQSGHQTPVRHSSGGTGTTSGRGTPRSRNTSGDPNALSRRTSGPFTPVRSLSGIGDTSSHGSYTEEGERRSCSILLLLV